MNVNNFYQYLNNPNLLNKDTLVELEEVIQRYPYFQLVKMLYLKNLYLLNDDRFQQTLEQFTIYFPDRKALYDFIHSKNDDTLQKTDKIVQEVSSIKDENAEAQISIHKTITHQNKKDKEDKIDKKEDKEVKNDNISEPICITNDNENNKKLHIADIILNKLNKQNNTIELKENTKIITNENIQENHLQTNTFTFNQWLDKLSSQQIKNESTSLIDNFIQKLETLEKIKPTNNEKTEDLTQNMLPPEELEVISEQLAQLYYKQGHLERALRIYEKLFLKYPEKSIYFASLINEIKLKLDKN